MIELIDQVNGKIKLYFNSRQTVKIAAYLYRRDECVEKIMYQEGENILLSTDIEEGIIYYVVGYIRDIHTKEITSSEKIYFYSCNGKIINVETSILLESDNVLIRSYDQGSEITFVTFLGTRTTKKTKPFAMNFAIENGWNCISVHQDNDTQYQELSTQQFYDAVHNSVDGKTVFMYGVSLGGYCAVYYAGIINANVIAGSPKNSAHPKYLGERFHSLEFKHQNISDLSSSSGQVIILYDPYQLEDVAFINNEILPSYPNAFLLALPNAGHKVLEPLAQKKLLKPYIISVVKSTDLFLLNNGLLRDYLSIVD